jgi:hypothetical protein
MKILHLKSEPRQTIFAPEWYYIMGESKIEGVDFSKIAQIILSKEKQIIESTQPHGIMNKDGYTGLGENSLTSRFRDFNVFNWEEEEIQKLKQKAVEQYRIFMDYFDVPKEKVWIECWANVMRTGQEITPHIHSITPDCYLGGHITVQCEGTSTIYINPQNQLNGYDYYESPNDVGNFTLFQNCIPHNTTRHEGSQERITIAFNLLTKPAFDNYEKNGKGTHNLVVFDSGETDGN